MNLAANTKNGATVYPARYFEASETYNKWVRLWGKDFHALRQEDGFEGQNTYFYANHPLRYVRLTGPVTSINHLPPNFSFLTIDDSSGAPPIEIKILRLSAQEADSPECPSNTVIPNVNISSTAWLEEVVIDSTLVDVGTVISAKGTITSFRGAKQLDLKRVAVLETTAQEVRAWTETNEFKAGVLSKPWILGREEMEKLDREDRERKAREKRREKLKREWYKKRNERMKGRSERLSEREEWEERRRAKQEREMNQGALI